MAKIKYDFKLTDFVKGLKFKNNDIKNAALADVKDYVAEQVLLKVGNAISPVTGGAFKNLSKDYAKDKSKRSGRPIANLELTGNMLDKLRVVQKKDTLTLEINAESGTKDFNKADAHNQQTGKAKSWAKRIGFPRRPFIPDAKRGESFSKDIKAGIKDIILTAKEDDKDG